VGIIGGIGEVRTEGLRQGYLSMIATTLAIMMTMVQDEEDDKDHSMHAGSCAKTSKVTKCVCREWRDVDNLSFLILFSSSGQ
jgi:hypothetical protein